MGSVRIQGFSTGTVRLKRAFLFASSGPACQPHLFLPGPFSDPMPIHVWVVEHDGQRILAHAEEPATVFLPSHDPDSAARLAAGETVAV